MRHRIPKSIGLILALLLLLGARARPGAAQSGLTMTARAGFDGFYKSGQWVPVYVTLSNSGALVEGTVQIVTNPASSTERLVYDAPVSLPAQSKKLVTLYVQAPNFTNTLQVQFLDENGDLAAKTATNSLSQLLPDVLLYGVVTPEPGEFGFLENVTGAYKEAKAAFLSLEELPETAVPWNNLDVLIIHDSDTGQLAPAQKEALNAWVDTGGQLVLAGGAGWQKTTAAFGDSLPVTISGSESVDDLPALAAAVGEPFRDPGPYVIANSSLAQGELLFHQDGLPLLARRPQGRGAVYFLALDPALAPLQDWDGGERFWSGVADQVPAPGLWGAGPQNGYAAKNAAASSPAATLPSVWQLGGLLLVYIVAIGPVNYWFLRRRNKLERAWLTIPVLALLFSGVAYLVGFQIRGTTPLVHQVSVAYSAVESDYARVYSLVGLFSPQRATRDLVFGDGALARPFGSDFGPDFAGNGRIHSIRYANDVTITGIRLDTAETQTFMAQNSAPAVNVGGKAALNLKGGDVTLDVTVINNSDVPLETASLLFGVTALELGDLAPGQSKTVSHIVGLAPAAGPSSGFSPVRPGYAPLTNNADVILGTFAYYDDRVLYGRYQLLETLDGDVYGTGNLQLSPNAVYLLAWSGSAQIDVSTGGKSDRTATTLYFIEIPLRQNIVSGKRISIPAALLHWEAIANSGVYEPAIQDLFLNQGWVELEYTPWPEFQTMQVNELALVMEAPGGNTSAIAPDARLWNWREESWDNFKAGWGETAVADPAPYVGPNNAVRIRLEDRSAYYDKTLDIVYPLLTGDLE